MRTTRSSRGLLGLIVAALMAGCVACGRAPQADPGAGGPSSADAALSVDPGADPGTGPGAVGSDGQAPPGATGDGGGEADAGLGGAPSTGGDAGSGTRSGGGGRDAGQADAGATRDAGPGGGAYDAGAAHDGGVTADAGAPGHDAGAPGHDAGVSPPDAGTPPDAGAPAPDPLAGLSDSFASPPLAGAWAWHQPGEFSVNVGGGQLSMIPAQSLWYMGSDGPMLYKLVRGDFRVTSPIHARSAAVPGSAPSGGIQLAGLIARDPASDTSGVENYVFTDVGFNGGLCVEAKTTVASVSQYSCAAWPSGDAELRLCRIGSTFHLYRRAIGAQGWTASATFDRSDLPAEVQVGPIVYAPQVVDLVGRFDGITFASVGSLADCTAD